MSFRDATVSQVRLLTLSGRPLSLFTLFSVTALCVAGINNPESSLWAADRLFLGPVGLGRALSGGWSDGTRNVTDEIWKQFNLADQRMWALATLAWLAIGLVCVMFASRRATQAAA